MNRRPGNEDATGEARAELARAELVRAELARAETAHPIADFTSADLTVLLNRAMQITAVVGAAFALMVWAAAGWKTGALFAVGAALSVGSLAEWGRLFRMVNARMDGTRMDGERRSGLGSGLVVALFLFRLSIFAVVIYVSLKSLNGSPIALLCGLGLGLGGLVWESMRVLRG